MSSSLCSLVLAWMATGSSRSLMVTRPAVKVSAIARLQLEPDALAAGLGERLGIPGLRGAGDEGQAPTGARAQRVLADARDAGIAVPDFDAEDVTIEADLDVDLGAGVEDGVGDELAQEQQRLV